MIDIKFVDQLRKSRGISKMEFYKLIGMSSTGYNQMFENNSMKIATLEKIAEVLKIPATELLAESITSEPLENYSKDGNSHTELIRENLYLLKESSRLKDEIIKLQKEIASLKEEKPGAKKNAKDL